MATTKKPRKRRSVTPAMKARDAANRAAANEALRSYAALCLADPAEVEQLRAIAASVGWKTDPSSDEPGYSLLNVVLLAAQRRPLVHCAGFNEWLEQGRCVAEGEKSLATFRHLGRKKTDEEKKQEEEDGWQTVEKRRGPKYYVKRGTFDVTQTIPLVKCPHCGTVRTGPEDRTTRCPADCAVFTPRPGVRPPLELVLALLQDLLGDDEDEGDSE